VTGAPRPVIPEPLAEALRTQLGLDLTTTEATVGGFSHLSFTARSETGRLVVVKAATDPRRRDDVRREAGVLRAWADAVEPPAWAPPLFGTIDDVLNHPDDPKAPNHPDDPNSCAERPVGRPNGTRLTANWWTAVVTYHLEGDSGVALLASRSRDLAQRFGQLGRLLAAVHRAVAAPSVLLVPSPDLAVRWTEVADALEQRLADVAAADRDVLAALIHAAHTARAGRGVTLVHGDAGLHNTIWPSPTTPVLIDWEVAGLGHPVVDVAWAAWTIHFRSLGAECEDALLDGYGRLPLRVVRGPRG
jgi:aminoglycoside phosphotransferase (APT) family kinase protein